MAEILKFVLVDEHDVEGDYEFDTQDEAIAASNGKQAVIMRTYEYSDSELVYTPHGSSTWPPRSRTAAIKRKEAGT